MSWVSNLVAVEVQDWKNRYHHVQWVPWACWSARSCKWAGLCLAVPTTATASRMEFVQDSAVSVGRGGPLLRPRGWSLESGVRSGKEFRQDKEAAEELLEASSSSVMNG